MIGTAIAVGVIGVVSAAIYFGMSGSKPVDSDMILAEFHIIKKALLKFRKEKQGLCLDIVDLQDYLPDDSNIVLKNYRISLDNKFIVAKGFKSADKATKLIDAIGGESYFREDRVYMSLLSSKKLSSVKAVAKISVSPKEHINTTTLVRFDSAQSIVEDGKLLEEEWKGKEDIYRKPGTHTVELRVKDKNDNWSEWATMDIEVAEKKGIKCLHAGGNSVFAVHFNGIVEAYGGNDYGQLGNSSNMPNKEFEPLVVASGCFDVATGGSHTLFIDLMRFVKSTGKNSIGQLGLGNRLDAKTFQKIWGLEKVKEVVCGENFSAALTYDGDVYTWGNNEYKQLGHSSKQKFVEMPKKVSGLARVKQIALGKSHTVCLLHDGTLVAWGENTFGQLGLGYKGRSNEMGICTVKNIAYVCASSGYTFAVTKNGRVQAFGINKRNQLGVVGEKEVLFPEEILQLKSIVKIVSCADFSVALDEIGQVYAWGQFDSLENDYPVKPEIIHGVKYAKDIAATSAHGYILTQDDKILEFGTDLGDLRVIRDSGEPKKEEA